MKLAGSYLKMFQTAQQMFQTAQQLGDAAVLSSLRHQQVLSKPSGFLTFSSILDLANQARQSLAEQGIPVTPRTLKEQAQAIIEQTKTMAEDGLGISYDDMGRYYE